MRKTLGALLLGGALLFGCSEKPQEEKEFFVNPFTGVLLQPRVAQKNPKTEKQVKPKTPEKVPEREDEITYRGRKYEISTGTYTIDNQRFRGIILTSNNEKYGLVGIHLENWGKKGLRISNKPFDRDKNGHGRNFKLKPEEKGMSKRELFEKRATMKRIGGKKYFILRTGEKMIDSDQKTRPSLRLIFGEYTKKNFEYSELEKKNIIFYSAFEIPVKID